MGFFATFYNSKFTFAPQNAILMQRFFLLCLFFACFSCANEPEKQPVETPTITLPNQPEAVVRQWQNWVDNNCLL